MKNDLKITFFSNFLLHHQTPFCEAMVKLLGDNFRFVATEPVPEERLGMGYHDYTDVPYAVNAYENKEKYEKAMKLGVESDVVIIGSAPDVFIEKRLYENKLTFRYRERYFKDGRWRILDPRVFRARYKADFKNRSKDLYMLCASAYTAPDCRFIHSYKNKMYRWGYFPEVKKYSDIEDLIKTKKQSSILWVGRLLELKHPEDAINLAEKLKQNGYDFNMQIIGQGEKENEIRSEISRKNLSDVVSLKGFMSPEDVRCEMEKADIFLFTSDRNEGWGAVLNESMNSACAVVANKEIGSVPYLIKNGENGLIYKRYDKDDLFIKVKSLLDDENKKHKIQLGAYNTMANVWNADVAAERLINLIESIIDNRDCIYKDGPCSKEI
ncbi:MAG: glycosyltransferase [Clostridia bacterium]|nr:glycosyltransferase [Clostridia bacterium]